uniref:Macaca fascicularis brain cDNA, clone: QbsB-10690 n=1 Tax=Macaca fascicularis TaxID=9541 RepID=I7GB59_MACFA|nr:unnamed protein product [Macaca fascicularis]
MLVWLYPSSVSFAMGFLQSLRI